MTKQRFGLDGKIALVTGASGGIGSEIAKVLHQHGATVILSGTRQAVLDQLASTMGDRTHVRAANLSNTDEVTNLIPTIEKDFGTLDILICNAGITQDTLGLKMSEEMFDNVINVNLKASFLLNRDAIKVMFKKKWGRIINISSIVGSTGNPGQANYTASKAGLEGMMRSLAQEVAPRNITINAIAPGFIDTNMTANLSEKVKEQIMHKIPSKRMGSPEDIANAALYLASNEACYVTGHTLHVNGGMHMA